jgi:ABC-type transport system involved in multi-copper enzyme maturation permease subunit
MATTTTAASPAAATHPSLVRFARGLSWGVRTLVVKELLNRSRGSRPVLVLTVYLLALAGGVVLFLNLARDSAIGSSPWLGLHLFSVLAFGAVLMMAFITPSLTAGAISGERERRTLDLLLVTRASALGLVVGKLAGSLVYVLFLLVATLPAFALVYLYGGIPLEYLALVLAIASATAIANASLGLLLSALLRRTAVASVASYLVVAGLVFVLPVFSAMTRGGVSSFSGSSGPPPSSLVLSGSFGAPLRPGQQGGPPSGYTYASPLVALSSALPAAGGGFGLDDFRDLTRLMAGGSERVGLPGNDLLRSVYYESFDPRTGPRPQTTEVWAPWLYYVGGSLAFVPPAVLLTALIIIPRKPWQGLLRWPRRQGNGINA